MSTTHYPCLLYRTSICVERVANPLIHQSTQQPQNSFGHVSPTSAAHVLADLGAHDIAILDAPSDASDSAASNAANEGNDGGSLCRIGIESTVAKVDAAGGVVRE